jgi:hypothetical protein
MQTSRIVQAVALMMIVALAASCAASKDYTSKLFAPRTVQVKDSQAVALRFLEMDTLQSDKDGWVSTDIIMGRDTGSNTVALDNLAKVFPAKKQTTDTLITEKKEAGAIVSAETKPLPPAEIVIAKNTGINQPVRNKRTRTDKP